MAFSPHAPWRSLLPHFPSDRLLLSPVATSLYRSDAQTALACSPAAVAFPVSAEEVLLLLRFCHEHRLPFLPRGHGTGLSGACCPRSPGSLVISLARMNRILGIDFSDRCATVQPGLSPGRLDREARLHGLRYLPAPGARLSSTLGGNLALDAAGPHAHLGGGTASQLRAATLILPCGSVVECGGAPAFGALGPDPLHLLARSEGGLGIVVEMTLSLTPLPETHLMLTASFPTLEAALEAADAILFSGVQPSRLEIFDPRAWEAMVFPDRLEDGAAAILWLALEGPLEETSADSHQVSLLLRQSGASRLDPCQESSRQETLLRQRDGLFSALGSALVQDAALPRSQLAPTIRFIQDLERDEAVPISLTINAATGNLFPAFHFEHGPLESFRRAERAALRFLLHASESGGSLSGCHGLGLEKRTLHDSLLSIEERHFEEALRTAFSAPSPHPSPAVPPAVPFPTSPLSLYPPLPGETGPPASP